MNKTYVYTNLGNEFYRLAWVGETDQGVYCGTCIKNKESHVSYHIDGEMHIKIKNEKWDVPIPKKPPLNEIENWEALLSSNNYSLPGGVDNAPPYKRKKKAAIAFIDQSVFNSKKYISISFYLINNSMECDFMTAEITDFKERNLTVTNIFILKLEYFTNHKIGIIIAQANPPWIKKLWRSKRS